MFRGKIFDHALSLTRHKNDICRRFLRNGSVMRAKHIFKLVLFLKIFQFFLILCYNFTMFLKVYFINEVNTLFSFLYNRSQKRQ